MDESWDALPVPLPGPGGLASHLDDSLLEELLDFDGTQAEPETQALPGGGGASGVNDDSMLAELAQALAVHNGVEAADGGSGRRTATKW